LEKSRTMLDMARTYVIVLRSSSSNTIFLRGCINFWPITLLDAAGRKKDRGCLDREMITEDSCYSGVESLGVH